MRRHGAALPIRGRRPGRRAHRADSCPHQSETVQSRKKAVALAAKRGSGGRIGFSPHLQLRLHHGDFAPLRREGALHESIAPSARLWSRTSDPLTFEPMRTARPTLPALKITVSDSKDYGDGPFADHAERRFETVERPCATSVPWHSAAWRQQVARHARWLTAGHACRLTAALARRLTAAHAWPLAPAHARGLFAGDPCRIAPPRVEQVSHGSLPMPAGLREPPRDSS